jgi:hypothetical protein
MSNEKTSEELGYELSDVNVKTLLAAGVAMVIATTVSFIFCFVVAKSLSQGKWENMSDFEKSQLAGEHNDWVEGTRLQPQPELELIDHKKEQHKSVNSWDKFGDGKNEPEIHQIPIDEAIDLVAEKGLPKFPVVEAKE